jgi:excisionase family DNA binding protein
MTSEISTNLDAARERLKAQVEAVPYLTVEEAAKLARCDPKTVRRAIAGGDLRAFRPANRLLFLEADVRGWVEARPVVAIPSRPRPTRRRRQVPGSVQALRDLEREASR